MIGIGGAGMSALARLYLQQGVLVSGSDESDSATLRDLARLGARVHVGHDPEWLGDADLVVFSSAVPESDPERVEAQLRGTPAIKHAQALAAIFNDRRGIAVAGTHGKTTTSAMIAFALYRCGMDPTFHVGGELVDLDTSAREGGDWMVVEADEFDRRFLEYRPEIAVVTNVEPDHFEYYRSVDEMEAAFTAFLRQVRRNGAIALCGHDCRLPRLFDAGDPRVLRYGIVDGAGRQAAGWQWRASDVEEVPGGSRFQVQWDQGANGDRLPATLRIPGRHNILNALAALAVCRTVGVDVARAVAALGEFRGVRRRFQLAGDVCGVRVYEDYAHHPTEVRASIAAARPLVSPGGKLWAVFQPHLYTRTDHLFAEFTRAFDAAERVLLTDVYSPVGREPLATYRGSGDLIREMRHPGAVHVADPASARELLAGRVRAGDLVLVMGAGPINQLAWDLVADLRAHSEGQAARDG
jgi:UDP-N-acetylmuramate--alanine ligase